MDVIMHNPDHICWIIFLVMEKVMFVNICMMEIGDGRYQQAAGNEHNQHQVGDHNPNYCQ